MQEKTITISQTTVTTFHYSLLAISFLIPFLISGPQLLTGIVVNALLFLFISQLPSKKILPIVILPSIGALLNGILFGKFTIFLLYFLPFIWIGNFVLLYSFSLSFKKNSFIFSVLISSLLKFCVLFLTALIFTNTKLVPSLFLQSMGVFQLYTAVLGGVVAFSIHLLFRKKYD